MTQRSTIHPPKHRLGFRHGAALVLATLLISVSTGCYNLGQGLRRDGAVLSRFASNLSRSWEGENPMPLSNIADGLRRDVKHSRFVEGFREGWRRDVYDMNH